MEFDEDIQSSEITLEGYLKKWTNCCTGWKQRYFVLKKNKLYYYLSKGMRYKGKLHLQIAEFTHNEKDILRFDIDTGVNKIYLKAYNVTDKNTWFDALDLAKRKEHMNSHFLKDDKRQKKENVPLDSLLMKKMFSTKSLLDELTENNKKFQGLKYESSNEYQYHCLLDKYKVNT